MPFYTGPFNVIAGGIPGGVFLLADLIRSLTSHTSGSGSWYFEMMFDVAADLTQVGVGIDNNFESLTVAAGQTGGICWLGNGVVNYNGFNGVYHASSYAVGDVLGVDTNLTAKTIRFRVNGGSFSSSFSISSIVTGPMFALAQLTDAGDQVTANFTGLFAFTPPSTAWG